MARAYLTLAGCVFIWALNYIIRQILLQYFSPVFLSAFSLTVVSVVFLIWACVRKRMTKPGGRDLLILFLSATIGLIANQLLLFKGLQHTSATNASLIFCMSPLMTAGLAALVLREKITWRMVTGCMIAVIGLFLALNMKGLQFSLGDLIMLGATFSFSCNLIFARMLSGRLTPFIVTVYSFTLSAVIFDPFVLSLTDIRWTQPAAIWALAFASVIIGQGITSAAWNKGMETTGASRASIILNLQPLMTILLDFLIFRSTVSLQQMLGACLVLAGVLFGTLSKGLFHSKKRKDSTQIIDLQEG